MPIGKPRLSLGGLAVEQSLVSVGFDCDTPGAALIETAPPTVRYRTVLVQNAWNVLPDGAFQKHLKRYPRSHRRRATARRALARWNLCRTAKVVCLTHAVASLVNQSLGIRSVVAEATVPVHDWSIHDRHLKKSENAKPAYALVPGTITWYKRPQAALDWLAEHEPNIRQIKIIGKDDGSGCLQDLQRSAEERSLLIEQQVVDHANLYPLYAAAAVTILPSSLESLGLGLSEALVHASRVVASAIPAHREIAGRVGTEAEWMFTSSSSGGEQVRPSRASQITLEEARTEWRRVGEELELASL
ncbi:hypothetical protein GCM10011575_46990 [Microlunatus endophyticus]|uniref:Glycosyl transferase family 1 domain-containing protein n=1 Tax=Microlunatus endophyticus TaxID=1716077 RepID=A0A917SJ41_9ACTN|nr:glycosyltransferase [Microlunatus endophyticus]GGL83272.1 hypothetical protein GCM10011575_46990 [Microlunatus endophyticus]